jgi:glycosyltransferase involved in cell wall biosynthesis
MLLSIITVNYNNASGLKKTIENVIKQVFENYEYIIIDGGSTDKSLDVIRQYSQHINFWMSEPDDGIYNAMNKGIVRAKGDYLLMLNSGDCLVNDKILDIVFKRNGLKDIIYGNVLWTENEKEFEESYPANPSFQFFRTNSIGHQAAFIRKTVHDIIGMYDEHYKIVSDWKFFLTAICKYNVSHEYIPLVVAVCERNGISCQPGNLSKIVAEKDDVLRNEFPAFLNDYIQHDNLKIELEELNRGILMKLKKRVSNLFKIINIHLSP